MDVESQSRKITLVFSVHGENGKCNSEELLEILKATEPAAVFEEVRPSDFDSYRRYGANSILEARAIAMYLEVKIFRRVPVDRYDIPTSLLRAVKSEVDSVLDYVEQMSPEYRLLNERRDESVREQGFSYLNSIAFASVMTKLCEIEDRTINHSGDQRLIRGLERWRQRLRNRDREMVGAIYGYCKENVFDTGVFLVGAGHRNGIVKEIEERASAEPDLIEWRFLR